MVFLAHTVEGGAKLICKKGEGLFVYLISHVKEPFNIIIRASEIQVIFPF